MANKRDWIKEQIDTALNAISADTFAGGVHIAHTEEAFEKSPTPALLAALDISMTDGVNLESGQLFSKEADVAISIYLRLSIEYRDTSDTGLLEKEYNRVADLVEDALEIDYSNIETFIVSPVHSNQKKISIVSVKVAGETPAFGVDDKKGRGHIQAILRYSQERE